MAKEKFYPDSHVEIQGFTARNYDRIMNLASLGKYNGFIRNAVAEMNIQPGETIFDLGCGTGRNACLMRPYLGDGGYYLGLDISELMEEQFRKNCGMYGNVEFQNRRADIPLELDRKFDTAFMSFVLHGFPPEIRPRVIKNIHDNLKPGGRFCLLDFGEFKLAEMPALHRWLFTTFECKYAFDFIERDWKAILSEAGFGDFGEHFWFKHYVRLLAARKQ